MAINYKFRKRTTVFTQLYLPSGTPTPATFAGKDLALDGKEWDISWHLITASRGQPNTKSFQTCWQKHLLIELWRRWTTGWLMSGSQARHVLFVVKWLIIFFNEHPQHPPSKPQSCLVVFKCHHSFFWRHRNHRTTDYGRAGSRWSQPENLTYCSD